MKSLQKRILIFYLGLFLPVNLILVIMGSLVAVQANRSMLHTAQEVLDDSVEELNQELVSLSEKMGQFGVEYQQQLIRIRRAGSQVQETYQVWSVLQTIRKENDFIKAGYLNIANQVDLRITIDRDYYSMEEYEQLKAVLEALDFTGFRYFKLYDLSDLGLDCWIINGHFGEISFGFLIPYEIVMGDVYDKLEMAGGELLKGGKTLYAIGNMDKTAVYAYQQIRDQDYEIRLGMKPLATTKIWLFVLFGLLLLTIAYIPLEWRVFQKEILEPMKKLSDGMQEIRKGNLAYRMEEDARTEDFAFLSRTFNNMTSEITELRIVSYEKELEKLRVQAVNISLQANPHLLLNSLSMIYSLSLSKNNTVIQEYTLLLMDYFRYSLRNQDELVPLRKELAFVEGFLRIQQIRFPEAIEGECLWEPRLGDVLVPPLLIQNFVENAIKHGREGGRLLHVKTVVKQSGDKLCISVKDDGVGMAPEQLQLLTNGQMPQDEFGYHVGVWNCRKRIELFYGGQGSLNIESFEGRGTTVTIELPITEQEECL